jgi:hypothetical protein
MGAGSRLPESIVGAQVVEISQVDLQETRRAGAQPAEAVAPGMHVQHGLDCAVDQEFVTQDAVEVEGVEDQLSARGVEALVGEHHGYVVVREAGQAEARGLVARVILIEQQVEAREALVDILGREVDAVIVIPERAQRLVDVAVGQMGGIEAGEHVRIILIVILAAREEVLGEAVALGRVVGVVQVGGHGREPEARVVPGERVDVADQDGSPVVGHVGGARADAVEAPDRLLRQLIGDGHQPRPLGDLIGDRSGKREPEGRRLVGTGAPLVREPGRGIGGGIGIDLRRRAQRRPGDGLLDRHDGELHGERRGRGAGALAAVVAAAPPRRPGAQTVLRQQVAGAREQAHLEEAPPVHQAGSDELLTVLEGVVHLLEPRTRDPLPQTVVVHTLSSFELSERTRSSETPSRRNGHVITSCL